LLEHDLSPKTGTHPRVKPEGRLFRDHAVVSQVLIPDTTAKQAASMTAWGSP
jgi:hypothetical protein